MKLWNYLAFYYYLHTKYGLKCWKNISEFKCQNIEFKIISFFFKKLNVNDYC